MLFRSSMFIGFIASELTTIPHVHLTEEVTIHVLDENDCRPVIRVPQDDPPRIPEEIERGRVLTVSVSDEDPVPINHAFSFSVRFVLHSISWRCSRCKNCILLTNPFFFTNPFYKYDWLRLFMTTSPVGLYSIKIRHLSSRSMKTFENEFYRYKH